MELSTFLETVTLKQVFDFIVGIVAVVSVIVEFNKKIPFHPWSFVFTQIGKALNKDVRSKLDELEQKCDANNKAIKEVKKDVGDMEQRMTQKLENSEVNSDTKEAKRLRARIIDFADSCRVHQKHTKTAFENITRDYGDYMEYCEKHDIPNHFIDAEFEYIKEVYSECQKENKFI